jgi:chorismate synthase
MSSEMGKLLHVSVFGESHGPAIGMVLDGLPAGEPIDVGELQGFLDRRRPHGGTATTERNEGDVPRFVSGISDGVSTGAPICALVENTDARSRDYARFVDTPRPSHADFTAAVRYGGHADMRGGGHFSGRLTAPLCIAGGIASQALGRRGIQVGAHLAAIGDVRDVRFDAVNLSADDLHLPTTRPLPVIDEVAGERMRALVEQVRAEGDSIGACVECAAIGLPAGLGSPMFEGVENRLAAALFGIPGVRGVSFGAGFDAVAMRGSQHNDPFVMNDGHVATSKNDAGGVLGGITTGMPLVFEVAFKPTASIARPQRTVDLSSHEETTLEIGGRHDPCIGIRAVPVCEAVSALVLLDLVLEFTGYQGSTKQTRNRG